jgi:hypothetical protein
MIKRNGGGGGGGGGHPIQSNAREGNKLQIYISQILSAWKKLASKGSNSKPTRDHHMGYLHDDGGGGDGDGDAP